jgi:signal recognition particle subunit SEC65
MAIEYSDFKEVKRKAEKVYYDMYEAQDMENPSVTTRLDRVENVINDIKQLKWYILAAIIASVIDIASNHIKF